MGGNNELALWAYITQTPIIVTHETLNTYTIYKSDVHTMPEKKRVSTLRSTHLQITRDYSEPVYLIYNGYHYNPIIHARSTQIIPIGDIASVDPPHPHGREQKTDQEQRRQGRQNYPRYIQIVNMC